MADPTTSPLIFPTAGVGGSYYDTAFQVPVYPNSPNNMLTWRWLDFWSMVSINYACTQGMAAGLIWATLTYLLALTPHRKRTTAFHSFMLSGLICLLVHLMIDMVSNLTPGLQSLSAYTALTLDIVDSVWTKKLVATFATSLVSAWFALVFALACLWLQAKNLMTGLKIRHPVSYRFIMGYLFLASMAALATGMVYSINQIIMLAAPPKNLTSAADSGYATRIAYLASYTICIGSYSLVSMVSVVDIVWRRPSSVMTGKSAYSTALNLIGLLCAQSFVIPFIFCILQIIPGKTGFLRPELMLLASVYAILPLGPLFMTVNSNPSPSREQAETPQTPTFPPPHCKCACHMPANAVYTDTDMTLTSGPTGSRPSSHILDGAHIERELHHVEAMECGSSVGVRNETTPERAAMLSDNDSQEKEVVVTMKMAA